MQVSTALTDYLASIKHLDAKSQVNYRQRLTSFTEWCQAESVELEQVNNRNVYMFLDYIQEHHKPLKNAKSQLSTHTLAGYVRCIWAFLYWCLEDEAYEHTIKLTTIKRIKMPRLEKTIKETFTNEEISALFAACQHGSKKPEYQLRDAAILAVLVDTGIRAEEVRTLTIGNVTLARDEQEESYILVMGKGRKEREVPLGKKVCQALSQYISEYRKDAKKSDLVFVSRQGGGVMTHGTLKDMLLRLKATSSLPQDTQVNPHKLRHTWASRFMANGGDVYDLSKLMGHSSIAITELYLRSLSSREVRRRKNHVSVLDTM